LGRSPINETNVEKLSSFFFSQIGMSLMRIRPTEKSSYFFAYTGHPKNLYIFQLGK
jgi:hypothetical protein